MSHLEFKYDADGRPLWHAPLPHPSGKVLSDDGKRVLWGPCQLCGEPWPCPEGERRVEPISITGIWLRDGQQQDEIEVLAEIDGEWRTVIVETFGGLLSHIVNPLGMRHARKDRLAR